MTFVGHLDAILPYSKRCTLQQQAGDDANLFAEKYHRKKTSRPSHQTAYDHIVHKKF